MEAIAIIPARGGSKRIPRKNIKDFIGKPMISYSIEAAIKSKMFSRVIVSTEDIEIAEISKSFGAEVPFFRPTKISDDYATTTEVISHAIEWLQTNQNYYPDLVCCIYATAPLIQIEDIQSGFSLIKDDNWDYVFSATSYGFPIFRSIQKNDNGSIQMFFPEYLNTRSQDLPEAFHDAGQFYWGKTEAWSQGKKIFEEKSSIILIPRWRVQDIDTLEDWKRAEIIYKQMEL